MGEIFGVESFDLVTWYERYPTLLTVHLAYNVEKLDNALAEVDQMLCNLPIGGISFSSKLNSEFYPATDDYIRLIDYVQNIMYNVNDLVDEPFYMRNNNIIDYFATIDANKLTTNNTIGLDGTYSTTDVDGVTTSETKKIA